MPSAATANLARTSGLSCGVSLGGVDVISCTRIVSKCRQTLRICQDGRCLPVAFTVLLRLCSCHLITVLMTGWRCRVSKVLSRSLHSPVPITCVSLPSI
eukprot:1142111-Pelagomonas_calceolata.AAC.1